MPMKQRRITLSEREIPENWYNIRADIANPAPPLLDSKTLKPVTADDLKELFPDEVVSHMTTSERWVPIPEPVREAYSKWRPTPLHRAYDLEKLLDTPAKIYYKNEAASLSGSHKINTAFAQAYAHQNVGCERLTSEVATGQWGAALCLAAQHFGMKADAFVLKLSHLREPYHSHLMSFWGGDVKASPSRTTVSGQKFHKENPFSTGVLGVATAEALESSMKHKPKLGYIMGGGLGQVDLHQSIIGLETIKQFEKIDVVPDVVISSFGAGTAFAGISYPMMHWAKEHDKSIRFIAVESSACPTLSRGQYRYDYIDTAGHLPLVPMYTLGHHFEAPPIFAGNLRFHGAGISASLLLREKQFEVATVHNIDALKAAYQFTHSEGVMISYSTCYAVVKAIEEALKCKESGEAKNIVFCLDGAGDYEVAGMSALSSAIHPLLTADEDKMQQSLQNLNTPLIEN